MSFTETDRKAIQDALAALGLSESTVKAAVTAAANRDKVEKRKEERLAKLRLAEEQARIDTDGAVNTIKDILKAINEAHNAGVVVTIKAEEVVVKAFGNPRKTVSGRSGRRGARVKIDGVEYESSKDACTALNIMVDPISNGKGGTWMPYLDALRDECGTGRVESMA